MSISLNGLGPTVTPNNAFETTIPFANLSFSGLANATTYTLTISLSDTSGAYDLVYGGSGPQTSSVSITDTGANLTADLESADFQLQHPWGTGAVPVTLSFALTSPSSQSLGAEQVYCFAAGTRVLTSRGDVAVESLREGDRVVTALGAGRLAPVRWVGRRTLSPARHPRPWDVSPIRIRAGAIGPGRPSRDLLLSPDHSLFIGGALIRARDLLNGATVVQDTADSVTYFHIELDRHDVLLAESVPAESFLDTGNRGAFENGGVPTQAHPEFARRVWQRDACAPLVWEGTKLEDARAMLAARAEELGWVLTEQADLHVTALGRTIRPVMEGGVTVFDLPAGCGSVRLRSRAIAPAFVLPGATDTRVLGVGVTSLALDGTPMPLNDAALGEGWLTPEAGLRWTGGSATVRVDSARRLTLGVASLLRYWVAPPEIDTLAPRAA
jgi:hypothetical protein